MKKAIIGGLLIATLSGCATKTIPLSSSVGGEYRGKSITFSVHEKPSFTATTADKAMFGAIGSIGMISKGNQIVEENSIPDPAVMIGSALVDDLAAKYSLIVIKSDMITESRKAEQIASDYNDADLVLDVQTLYWGFSYLPMDWDNYRIIYTAKLKLIDTQKSTELASGSYAYDSKDSGYYPSFDQLINNKADGLKTELKKAEAECIAEFRQRIFNAK